MTEKEIVQQLVSALDELLPEFEPENADELYDALTVEFVDPTDEQLAVACKICLDRLTRGQAEAQARLTDLTGCKKTLEAFIAARTGKVAP